MKNMAFTPVIHDLQREANPADYRYVGRFQAPLRGMKSYHTQRGFIFGIYGYLAIGLVVVALFAWGKVQSARLDAAQQKNVALEQQVSQWRNVAGECSKATEKAKTEADNRAAAALAALGRVKAESAKGKAEAERLRGLVGQKPVTECPAGEAAVKVREGLR